MICSQEEVCSMCVTGVTMFNQVLYVHQKKCVVCVWYSYHVLSHIISSPEEVMYVCGGDYQI